MIQVYLNKCSKSKFIIAVYFVTIFCTFSVSGAEPKITDNSISDFVKAQLTRDEAVNADRIGVAARQGIVSLTGTVDNLLARERAVRIAGTIKGVRAVVNNIEVVPPMSYKDWQIKDDVQDALLTDPVAKFLNVNVSVDKGKVILGGTVKSWQEQQLCDEIVKGVKGVRDISNMIKVLSPEKRSNDDIKNEIEYMLGWNVFLQNDPIDVAVDNGKVFLSGTVGSASEKATATILSHVTGVREVDNSELKVEKWTRDRFIRKQYPVESNREVEKAVMNAFRYDPRVSRFKITAEMIPENDALRLAGTVDNMWAKYAAVQDAHNTVGVSSVEDRIEVRPNETVSNKKIENDVKKAFKRDPFLNVYVIDVRAADGVVELSGTVDNDFEKSEARGIASGINGVISVSNNLRVRSPNVFVFDPNVDANYLHFYDWEPKRSAFEKKDDREILRDIKNQLFWNPFLNEDHINVKVYRGIVTLTGDVYSGAESDAAARGAYIGGAVEVINKLHILH